MPRDSYDNVLALNAFVFTQAQEAAHSVFCGELVWDFSALKTFLSTSHRILYLPQILSPDALLGKGRATGPKRDINRFNACSSHEKSSICVVFANGIYIPSARDARVRLGLVALPFSNRVYETAVHEYR
jgi:hypothetical protein